MVETYLNKADGLVLSVKVAAGDPDLSSTGKRVHPHQFWKDPFKSSSCCCLGRKDRDSRMGSHSMKIQKKD